MGNDCECCHKENNKIQQNKQNYKGNKYNPEIINRNFNDYIFQDKILDFPLKKYDMNDPVFKSVKKEENKMLTNFYKSKKDDFQTQMTAYLNNQNLNFVNLLTSQIIINENGTKLMKQKIKSEIENVENKEDAQFKISNLTVLILGQAGTGKSTLVNNILFDGKEVAKENDVDIGTTAFIAPYKNPKVPYLQLVDSRGIQLDNAWSINNIGDTASNFIREKLAQTNFNDFVHCIWYCVKNQRFVDIEKNLLEDINKITTQEDGTKKIPVIIVLTKALEPDYIRVMKEYIKNKKKFDDVVDVVAKRITLVQGMSAERRGLDTLVDLTVKKCKENFNGDLKKVMMKNLTQHVRETLFANNSMIRDKIIRIMKRDTVDDDLANKNFDKYVNDIYNYNVCYFLGLNQMSRESSNLIKTSEFNRHKVNFFSFCLKYIKNNISNELPFFANKFLDIQATKEIENNHPLQMTNKRNYNDFIKSSEKFLFDNFNYFASKFYIYFVIINICPYLSANFEKELNTILNREMVSKDIQENIAHCYYKKFDDFDKYKNNFPPFTLSINNSYNIPNFINNNKLFEFNIKDNE